MSCKLCVCIYTKRSLAVNKQIILNDEKRENSMSIQGKRYQWNYAFSVNFPLSQFFFSIVSFIWSDFFSTKEFTTLFFIFFCHIFFSCIRCHTANKLGINLNMEYSHRDCRRLWWAGLERCDERTHRNSFRCIACRRVDVRYSVSYHTMGGMLMHTKRT